MIFMNNDIIRVRVGQNYNNSDDRWLCTCRSDANMAYSQVDGVVITVEKTFCFDTQTGTCDDE